MDQLEEQKRIHDAETGILKTKLAEQAARISELEEISELKQAAYEMAKEAALQYKEVAEELRAELKDLERIANENLFNANQRNQVLKSELEKLTAGVVARFDAKTHIHNGAVLTDVVDASRGYAEYEYPFRKNKTYEVLILQKETE